MNAQDVIKDIDTLDRVQKQIYMEYARIFDDNIPHSYYMNYFELAWGIFHPDSDREIYPGNPNTTPEMWEKFLDLPEIYRFRISKIGKLAEFDANKAMQRLGANSDNVQALKEIVKTSKALQGGKSQQTIIMSYVSPKVREKK